MIVASTFNIGADLGAMAASLRLLVPVPLILGVALFTIGMTALEVWVPYRRYAKILRWLVLSLIAYRLADDRYQTAEEVYEALSE